MQIILTCIGLLSDVSLGTLKTHRGLFFLFYHFTIIQYAAVLIYLKVLTSFWYSFLCFLFWRKCRFIGVLATQTDCATMASTQSYY